MERGEEAAGVALQRVAQCRRLAAAERLARRQHRLRPLQHLPRAPCGGIGAGLGLDMRVADSLPQGAFPPLLRQFASTPAPANCSTGDKSLHASRVRLRECGCMRPMLVSQARLIAQTLACDAAALLAAGPSLALQEAVITRKNAPAEFPAPP